MRYFVMVIMMVYSERRYRVFKVFLGGNYGYYYFMIKEIEG